MKFDGIELVRSETVDRDEHDVFRLSVGSSRKRQNRDDQVARHVAGL